jgi:hypothetical protein
MNFEVAASAETDQIAGNIILGLSIPMMNLQQINPLFGVAEPIHGHPMWRDTLNSTEVAAPLLFLFKSSGDFLPVLGVPRIHVEKQKLCVYITRPQS